MKKKKLNFNACLTAKDAADVINALTEGLKEQRLHFQKGDEDLLLEVNEAVNLSIEARYKDGKAKVVVEATWDVPQKDDADEDQGKEQGSGLADEN
ncbi:MAG: amphi-Trp domain-containing protein [Pseudomonadota bacterium]